MALAHSPRIVTDGLVLCLDAANPKSYPGSGATWLDVTGNGYNATLINSPTYDSNIGFISFNGTNQYATHTVPAISSGTTDFTFELIFKIRTLPTVEYTGQIWGGENGNDIVSYVNPASNGKSTLNLVYDDSRYGGQGHYSNYAIGANEWVHWVAQGRQSDSTIAHYINGKLDKTFTSVVAGQEVRSRNADAKIAYDARALTYTQLDISIIKEYHRLLNPLEIQQNFNAVRGRFGI